MTRDAEGYLPARRRGHRLNDVAGVRVASKPVDRPVRRWPPALDFVRMMALRRTHSPPDSGQSEGPEPSPDRLPIESSDNRSLSRGNTNSSKTFMATWELT